MTVANLFRFTAFSVETFFDKYCWHLEISVFIFFYLVLDVFTISPFMSSSTHRF